MFVGSCDGELARALDAQGAFIGERVYVLWVPQVKKKNMMDVLLVLCSQSFLGTLLGRCQGMRL
jgi:hypothetical protein